MLLNLVGLYLALRNIYSPMHNAVFLDTQLASAGVLEIYLMDIKIRI